MNLVQFLHSGIVQDLHFVEMQILPPGRLDAIFTFRPEGKELILGRMQ